MITEHVGVTALTHVHARPGGRGVLRFDQQGWALHRSAFAWPDLKRLMIWVVVATWVLAVLATPFHERLEHDDTAQLVAAIIATPMFLILVGLLLYWSVNLIAEVVSIVFTVVTLGHFHRNPPRWLQRLRAARRRKSASGEPSAPVAAHRYDSVVDGRVLHRFRRTVVLLRTTDGRTLRYRTWGFAGRTRLLGNAFAEHLGDRLR